MPSDELRWLHHRALLRRKHGDRGYRVLPSRVPVRFPTPVSPLALMGSSALCSALLSPCLFATMASADFSGALTPELSPGKVSELSKRAVRLYPPRRMDFGLRVFLASLPLAPGLSASSCSYGRSLPGARGSAFALAIARTVVCAFVLRPFAS
jgi:hypothetical protein